jgi:arylsulfatase B
MMNIRLAVSVLLGVLSRSSGLEATPTDSAVRVVLFAAASWAVVAVAEERQMPNILIILADDMGYGDLSCYGSMQIQTPQIDMLAAAGVRCTNGYVSGVVCAPSRAGLMTGRYQNRFGFEHNIVGAADYYDAEQIGLPTDEVTMADRLRALGYATACIGKWHLGNSEEFHPNSRGFDYYFGRLKGHGYFPRVSDQAIFRQREPVESVDVPYTTDWYTIEAISFIDRVPGSQPWFLYLAHDTPHTPLQAKVEDLARYAHISNKSRRTICAMQHCLDENVGRLTRHLKETDRFDNTLIAFFSDNGGVVRNCSHSINAPLRGKKALFLDGGMHVPFVFSWPDGGLAPGSVYE